MLIESFCEKTRQTVSWGDCAAVCAAAPEATNAKTHANVVRSCARHQGALNCFQLDEGM
jgi:hypothetical protein